MKYIITENKLRRVQFKYLNYLFEDIYEVNSKNNHNSRFWKKGDEIVLELETGNINYNTLWVLDTIWKDIDNMFSSSYDETQQIIREWVEQYLELKGVTPRTSKQSLFRTP
jgi:hypothetical protein